MYSRILVPVDGSEPSQRGRRRPAVGALALRRIQVAASLFDSAD
jgi:hypothetical protein